jgi:hypothetical protein
MVARAGCAQRVHIRGISDTPYVWLYQGAKSTTHRARRIRVWITIPETGHHVSRWSRIDSLQVFPAKEKSMMGRVKRPWSAPSSVPLYMSLVERSAR